MRALYLDYYSDAYVSSSAQDEPSLKSKAAPASLKVVKVHFEDSARSGSDKERPVSLPTSLKSSKGRSKSRSPQAWSGSSGKHRASKKGGRLRRSLSDNSETLAARQLASTL